MARDQNPNIELLTHAIRRLDSLAEDMVFVGGCATGLLITDSAAAPVRATRDVDAIVHVLSRTEYYQLAGRLRSRGFSEDASEGAPLCRWVDGTVILDVMPSEPSLLGFGNEWYLPAVEHAVRMELPSGESFRLVSPPYFLMTKLEAFSGRGANDYLLSHDIEDLIAVIDGRPEIVDEVEQADAKLRTALSERFSSLLQNQRFVDAVPGHLPPVATSPARVALVLARIQQLAELG